MSSEVTDEKATITIEVELKSKVTGDLPQQTEPEPFLSDVPDDVREYINQEINTANEDALAEVLTEDDVEPITQDAIKGAVDEIGTPWLSAEDVKQQIKFKLDELVAQLTEESLDKEDVERITKDTIRSEKSDDEEFEDAIIAGMVEDTVNQQIKDAVTDALKEQEVDIENLKELDKLVKDIQGQGIQNVKSMAKNPQGFMENTLIGILGKAGPYGALAASIVGAIAATPEMVKAVVEALGVKGGPLNQDYAFTEAEQMNMQFDRMVQWRRLTGDDPVITVHTKGFVAGDKDFVDNSLIDVNTARTARIGLQQSSLGYQHGV